MSTPENWRPIVGYEGLYEVSDRGRVRSLDRVATDGSRRRGHLRKLIPIGADRQKYLSVALSRASKVKCVRVHTLVLETFVGPRPLGQQARHRNGKSIDNRRSNLVWGTSTQNTADKARHGTQLRGERVPTAKLRKVDVLNIRRRYCQGGVAQRTLAYEFGISQRQVSRIARGIQWAS